MSESIRTNGREQHCERCAILVTVGAGRLEHVPDAHDDDDFARVGTHRERAHWTVCCLDTTACDTRIREQAERAAADKATRQAAAKVEADRRAAERAAADKRAAEINERFAFFAAAEGLVYAGGTFDLKPLQAVTAERNEFGSLYRLPAGIALIRDASPSSDDSRSALWAVPELVEDCYRSYAIRHEVRPQKAAGHLKKYGTPQEQGVDPESLPEYSRGGCWGLEFYRWAAARTWTEADQAAIEEKKRAEYAKVEAQWRRDIESAVKPRNLAINPTDPPRWQKGCPAWEAVTAAGAVAEAVIDPQTLSAFSRAYADSALYSKERDALTIEVTILARLPDAALKKDGTVKAAVQRKLPSIGVPTKTNNRYITVRVALVSVAEVYRELGFPRDTPLAIVADKLDDLDRAGEAALFRKGSA